MKLKNILLRTIFFVIPLFLLDLYLTPERSLNEKVFYLMGLIPVGILVSIFGIWIEKKYPYESSHKTKNTPDLEKDPEKITE